MLAALSVMAASCNKTFTEPSKEANEEEVTYLTFDVDAEVTKATSVYTQTSERESALMKNFQVVAYDLNNDTPGNVSSWFLVSEVNQQNKFTVPLKTGKKRMLFICNQGLLKTQDAPNWGERSKVITKTKDAITDTFLPLGLGFKESSPYDMDIKANANQSVNITLQHMCSRLVLKSIANEMPSGSRVTQMMGKFVTLLNVPHGMRMNGQVVNVPYYQQLGQDFSTAELCAGMNGAGAHFYQALTYSGQTMDTLQPALLYTYPGDKVHMLVGVDITLTNETQPTTYYYAIPVKNLDFNKSYDVHLKVKNLGSTSPTDPSIVHNSEFTVTVADWDMADAIVENM